jgi:acetyl-CoA carboxylase carboxyl transferase subunit beta
MIDHFRERKENVKAFQNSIRSRQYKEKEINIPDDLYVKCQCDQLILKDELAQRLFTCPHCDYHFRITAKERMATLADVGSFNEMFQHLKTNDPLSMPGYKEKLTELSKIDEFSEAIMTGTCNILGYPFAIAVMDSHFLMGSMGTVVGEKIVQLCEYATATQLPILIVTTSGGARMQEGILSLMQMAKTTAAIKKHSQAGLLYLSVLTDPTMGGVSASFAMMADVIMAEPSALIGFAGPRVIKQTIKQDLPKDFQSSEFLLEHGLIDMIIKRSELKQTLAHIAKMFGVKGVVSQ